MNLIEGVMGLGFKVVIVEDYTYRVQARRHKRKSSHRWQKKWLKRFGTKLVSEPMIPDGESLQDKANAVLYMNRRTEQAILNHPEFQRMAQKANLTNLGGLM